MPILYFWHVFEVLANIDVMLIELAVEHVDHVRNLGAQPGNIFKRIHRKMKPAKFVDYHHVERSGRRSFINETTHVKTGLVGTPVDDTVNGPTVAVERKDYRGIWCKESFERDVVHAVRVVIGTRQDTEIDHAHVSTTMNVYGNALMESKRETNSKIVQLVLGQETGELDEEISDEMYAGHTSRPN